MKINLILLLASGACLGAIGDHAPSIPATMCTTHPCMTPPDNTYLDAVWTARATAGTTGAKYIFDAANAWVSPTSPSGQGYVECRRLIVSYMSAVRPGHDASLAATYLAKIKTMGKTAWEGAGGTNSNALAGSLCEAMAYDWLFSALDSTTKSTWVADMQAWLAFWENDRNQDSPYNDVTYIRGDLLAMPVAIAQYLEGGSIVV